MSKYLLLITIIISLLISSENKLSIKIHISSIDDIIELNEMHIEFDHHRTLYEIHAYASQEDIHHLRLKGFKVDIIENEAFSYFNELKADPNYINNPMEMYHNYSELTEFLQAISNQYPDITNLFSIGQSVQGRELWVMEITDNAGENEIEPEFKYIANMHGDETPGREFSLYLIEWLCEGYNVNDRATNLVNNTAIFIMPSMNPDGFELGQRENANGVDLNRDFPDQFDDPLNTLNGRQPETSAVMEWSWNHNFILSANMHSGALVANYPFDGPFSGQYSATPDDAMFIELALAYSENHENMYNSSVFDNGITNGAEWYAVSGGMQDWNYVWEGDFDITLEQYNTKWPNANLLESLWNENKESMIAYIEKIHSGINGVILNSETGEPLNADIIINNIDYIVKTDPENGDYYRLLTPGEYLISFHSIGFIHQEYQISINDTPIELNINLVADPSLEFADIENFESNGFNQYDWEFSGNSSWTIDNTNNTEGNYCARAGNINSNQETILSITTEVLSDGEISFYKKVSCEDVGQITGNYYDYLLFEINGIEQDKWAGYQDWSLSTFPIVAGENTFTWTYLKDGGVDSGEDTAWIDYIIFPQITSNIIIGDINFDEIINILDVVILVNFILDVNQPNNNEFLASDIDGNNQLNVLDIIQLINIILN